MASASMRTPLVFCVSLTIPSISPEGELRAALAAIPGCICSDLPPPPDYSQSQEHTCQKGNTEATTVAGIRIGRNSQNIKGTLRSLYCYTAFGLKVTI